VVERSPEKAGVGGSTPSLATKFFFFFHIILGLFVLLPDRRPDSSRTRSACLLLLCDGVIDRSNGQSILADKSIIAITGCDAIGMRSEDSKPA
jgi:hypothetical protein